MKLVNIHEAEKESQTDAGYMIPTDPKKLDSSGLFSCGECRNFLPPNGCNGVAGKIYKGGCCNYYESSKAKKP
jgi:hypothetical protein